jgi:hypothetical protein
MVEATTLADKGPSCDMTATDLYKQWGIDAANSDVFEPPKFKSVIDRYYTRLYRKVTSKSVAQMLLEDQKKGKTLLSFGDNCRYCALFN